MRKLILLALAIGTVELFKRHSARMGLTPSTALANAAESGLHWLRGTKREELPDDTAEFMGKDREQ